MHIQRNVKPKYTFYIKVPPFSLCSPLPPPLPPLNRSICLNRLFFIMSILLRLLFLGFVPSFFVSFPPAMNSSSGHDPLLLVVTRPSLQGRHVLTKSTTTSLQVPPSSPIPNPPPMCLSFPFTL